MSPLGRSSGRDMRSDARASPEALRPDRRSRRRSRVAGGRGPSGYPGRPGGGDRGRRLARKQLGDRARLTMDSCQPRIYP